ncbi:MAG: hypothetical protein LBH09_06790, partial [Peptococcaceae bacterium]|nr:hypothetical protein [Peptococcaceae bacterium]
TAKIAWEKAGIIKEGVSLITACDDRDALQVIQKEFNDVQGEGSSAGLWQARGKCHWKTRSLGLAGQIVDLATPSQYYENIELPLPGQYQCVNLACAALTWELLVKSYFPALNMFSQRKLMKETLQKGITSVSWPCRLELVQEKPDVVLDGSHNPDGLRHLAVWLSEHRHLYRQVLLVMGMVQDKDRLSAAKHLNGLVSQVIITKPLSDRAGAWEGLAEGFDKSKTENVEFIEDCHQAVQKAIELAGECDLVLCTGSFFLVGELRKNWIAKEMFSR